MLQMLVGTSTAFVYILNVFIGPLSETYGWDMSTIALEFTFLQATGIPACIIGGKMRDKWGSKKVLKIGGIGFAVSVLFASLSFSVWFFVIGMGVFATFFMYVVYISQMANIGELFVDKRGLALGIGVGGINVGSALIAPLAEYLLRVMGVSQSIALQGVFYGALVLICGFLIVEPPEKYRPKGWNPPEIESVVKDEKSADSLDTINRDIPWKKMLVTLPFWLFFIALICCAATLAGLDSNLSLIAQNIYGVDAATGAWYYTIYAIGMGSGALVIGLLSDRIGPLLTIGLSSVLASGALVGILVEGFHSTTLFIIAIVIAGLVVGGIQSVIPNVLMTAFGEKYFGINFGLIMLAAAIAALIGPQIAVRYDVSVLFTVGAILGVLGLILSIVTRYAINRKFGFKIIK
jgi:OFA family oxalate/formate antiporter-like MFS transporter